ncbi:MAG TPA: hypothetical protein PLU22_13355 [Polyangiaceae bacterium]|nr:hypothetical protein [Polyangiaceae bacterium]
MRSVPAPGGLGRRAFLAVTTTGCLAAGLGRTPRGGLLRLSVPWPLAALDPHAIDDACAALFGAAVAEPLFALDPRGRPYPALAATLPERGPKGTVLRLRPFLRSGRGASLDGRDLIFSWQRARARAAAGLLGPFGEPFHDREDGLVVVVPDAEPEALALALTSPVTALVPRGFDPRRPDGTGPFTATPGREQIRLERNAFAARGAPWLDAVEVRRATDLADALRAFESGEVDVGWLGRGLHRPRAGATDFVGPPLGWATLWTGRRSGTWGAPGVAQRLLDGIDPARLDHLGFGALPPAQGSTRWGGAPTGVLVRDDAPQLARIASAVASALGQPGHELTVEPLPGNEIQRRRRDGDFALMVEFVRSLGRGTGLAQLALLAAADPAMARRPPRGAEADVRVVGRTLPLGVIGEVGVRGAEVDRVRGLAAWDFGAMFVPRR